jgi:hypothetical protein
MIATMESRGACLNLDKSVELELATRLVAAHSKYQYDLPPR